MKHASKIIAALVFLSSWVTFAAEVAAEEPSRPRVCGRIFNASSDHGMEISEGPTNLFAPAYFARLSVVPGCAITVWSDDERVYNGGESGRSYTLNMDVGGWFCECR
ncbi:hypothetical protein [Sorangium sp. So ce1151]|uniref:hypothetical protein n=1 Tax=Sorangium sp. So ce1151 TaxID=3133332 RepID=UPI003F5F387E